jgi:hypothetical protein
MMPQMQIKMARITLPTNMNCSHTGNTCPPTSMFVTSTNVRCPDVKPAASMEDEDDEAILLDDDDDDGADAADAALMKANIIIADEDILTNVSTVNGRL